MTPYASATSGHASLTKEQNSDLVWMTRVKGNGCGLFGPSVHKHGPVESCEQLCAMGLAEYRKYQNASAWGGYFITEAGRAVLNSLPESSPGSRPIIAR